MKTLVVYMTISGHSKNIATQIAKDLKADVEGISEKTSRKNPFGFIRSGFESATKKCPSINVPKKKVKIYDLVIFVSPIWAGKLSSPVRSYLKNYTVGIKATALFVNHAAKANGYETAQADFEAMVGKKALAFGTVCSAAGEDAIKASVDKFVKSLVKMA